MNEKNSTAPGTQLGAGTKTYCVHARQTQEKWRLVTIRARSPEEAEELAEGALDPTNDWHHGTSRVEAVALTENGAPLPADRGRPTADNPSASASMVPPPVATALRGVVGLYLEDEARDFLVQDEVGRASHVLPHLVALARYAAPDCLGVLADCAEVLLSLSEQ